MRTRQKQRAARTHARTELQLAELARLLERVALLGVESGERAVAAGRQRQRRRVRRRHCAHANADTRRRTVKSTAHRTERRALTLLFERLERLLVDLRFEPRLVQRRRLHQRHILLQLTHVLVALLCEKKLARRFVRLGLGLGSRR